jgi:hypothetical protein
MENPFGRIYNLRKAGKNYRPNSEDIHVRGADARKWIGRIIMALILGEAIWSLIVSVINNLVVPWLGDVMGQASGLPTSFTQRAAAEQNYPSLQAHAGWTERHLSKCALPMPGQIAARGTVLRLYLCLRACPPIEFSIVARPTERF